MTSSASDEWMDLLRNLGQVTHSNPSNWQLVHGGPLTVRVHLTLRDRQWRHAIRARDGCPFSFLVARMSIERTRGESLFLCLYSTDWVNVRRGSKRRASKSGKEEKSKWDGWFVTSNQQLLAAPLPRIFNTRLVHYYKCDGMDATPHIRPCSR
jgi:hypothetical protein